VSLVSRARTLLVLVALCCGLAVVAVDSAPSRGVRDARVEVEVRRVVTELFRTLNERRYERTCSLLADGYFDGSPLGRRQCALGLRIGFMWSNEFRVSLAGVRVEGDRAVVRAVVNGAPGRIQIVREDGRYRILRIDEH
jgi:hypothetical protein